MNKLVYIFVFIFANLAIAQTVIEVQSDTDYVFIGDIINVDLAVRSNAELVWPDIPEVVAPLEVQYLGEIDTLQSENTTLYQQRVTLQSFDTGIFVMPTLPFVSLAGDTFYSDSLAIAFLAVPLDTTNAIFDIKQPREVPFNFAEAQVYIWGGLALILLIVLMVYLIKKFTKKSTKKSVPIVLVPCEIEANEALKQLELKEYITKGLIKPHYIELTDILRRYFDREFYIDTQESTTYETVSLLKAKELDKHLILQIEELLEEADLVKFAKGVPDTRTSTNYMAKSFEIVNKCHAMKVEVKDV